MEIMNALPGQDLYLGRRGEHLARQIVFDISSWVEEYGSGSVKLLVQQHRGQLPYPAAITHLANVVTWDVTAADTAAAGTGRYELHYYVGETLVKSDTGTIRVSQAMGGDAAPAPEAQPDWLDRVLLAVNQELKTAVSPPRLSDRNTWLVWDSEAGAYVDSGVVAEGTAASADAAYSDYYIHISFDDVEYCTGNLGKRTYASVWDEPFFGWLKDLHERYGARFSLYVYDLTHLASIPDRFKPDLLQASTWLKFGLHSTTSNGTYGSSTYAQGQNDWNYVVNQVLRFAGSHRSIDRIPRLNYFEGTLDALKGMRDANCGALGFLCSDAVRDSYYLDSQQNGYLLTHDHIIDFTNGLLFYQTDFRGDWFKPGFTSTFTYDAPTENNVYDELVRRLSEAKYGDTCRSLIWFCHEWQLYTGSALNSYKIWVEDACRFAYDYGIRFDYPQNRIGVDPTSYRFLAQCTCTGGDSGSSGEDSGNTGGDSGDTGSTVVTLTRIAVTTPPNKTVYTAGENFSRTGMVVTATYSDGSTAVVSGYLVSGGTNLTAGTAYVTVSYTEDGVTRTTTQAITVSGTGSTQFLVSDYTTFKIGQGQYWAENTWELLDKPNRLSADIRGISFEAGDVISIGDYNTYKFAIGTNWASTSPNNQLWINGGYQTADYTLKAADLADMVVFMVTRLDDADMTANDVAYISANAKFLRA